MAISFWKCLERRDGRTRIRPRAQNSRTNVIIKNPKYQNSYRLESYNPFRIDPVDGIIKSMMENRLEDVEYDANTAPGLCSQIASEIRNKIIKLNFDRYKIVVVVTIIENTSQSLDVKLGFLWDVDKDKYSTYNFETRTFLASCFVVGIYYE